MKKLKKRLIIGLVIVGVGMSAAFQSDFFEVAKQLDIYTSLFKELNMYYIDEINPAEITEKSINNMLGNLDPYTRYFDEQGVEAARIASTGEYGGIGAKTRFNAGILTIREILKNSPAEKAGLRAGDRILKIDDAVVADFDDTSITALLNGLPNSKVNLQISRQNREQEITVVRKKITIKAVPYFTMLDAEVGYISFTQFNESASREVREAFIELKDQGMKKLIIDVRSNPGGLLNEAVRISNFFIPKNKVVVTTKAKIEKWSDTFTTKNDPIDLEMPLAILINGKSASASEILAGSLQDYDRAVIIGERSFGKGLVQRYRELSYGTQMKITISKYYTPSGRCIQELDYTNRDKEGNVPKFSDSGREAYTTENGRTVYGGGGIEPDIKTHAEKINETTAILLESDAFFNFATQYYNENPSIEEAAVFELKNKDFEDLKEFLSTQHPYFETKTEALFKEVNASAANENLNANLTRPYEQIMRTIQEEKLKELDANKERILIALTEEIVKRYYYVEGVYEQKAALDKVIASAKNVLNNEQQYLESLGNRK